MIKRPRLLFGGIILGAIVVAAVFGVQRYILEWGHHSTVPPKPLVDQATLNALPHKSASNADVGHLSAGMLPPTNMWLSGMVLQKVPEAVYPMPNSFLAEDNGFEIGLPTVTAKATEIDGQHTPGITADLGATGFRLTRYDKLSAALTYQKDSRALGSLTITEGSPFVFYTAAAAGTVAVGDINPADILQRSEHYVRYNRSGHTYAVSTQKGSISVTSGGLSVSMQKGALVTFYAIPSATDPIKAYAGNAIRSVALSHKQIGNTVSTTFSYQTADGKPTVFAALPYENVAGKGITSYQSIWGQMKTMVGTSFTATTPAVTPANQLNLSKLTPNQKATLVASLPLDVAATKIDQQDSYYAGKQLARAANLLSIAEQLEQTDSTRKLKNILNDAFDKRLGTGYFYYDTTLRGVAASTAAFGSEDFNDHHFHYGYWLYAGSILANYDRSFLDQHKTQLNLLAADIASYQPGSQFPLYRTYDPYAGHSWAAGLAPFADGNNQESSSEALNAWNGVSMWGKATKNTALQQIGQWMLANESNTAQKAWRTVDMSDKLLAGYTSPLASLNFAGKRTYATFFSDAASAKLGIQLLPMNPSMVSFASDGADIGKVVQATVQDDNYNVPLGDYILMYLALADPQKAASLAPHQTNIDDGNSITYLNAFIFSQLDR